MNLYNTVFGYEKISVSEKYGALMLNICMKYRYPYSRMENADGRIYLTMTVYSSMRLASRLMSVGADVIREGKGGLPVFLRKYGKRYGLWLGAVFAAIIIYMSGRVVWDIRIEGNETISDSQIENVLLECGFSRGKLISDFNADKTEAYALLKCDKLAWISVNMKGTVAYVEVREKIPIDDTKKPTKPANIVAAHSGKIIEIIAYDGLCEVKAGDEVKKGDLLISGAYGEKNSGS